MTHPTDVATQLLQAGTRTRSARSALNPGRAAAPAPRPAPPGRLAGVDAARGLALLGMMATHALLTQAPDGGASLAHTLAGGRSAALFALLAAAGVAFTTGRRRVVDGRIGVAAALLVRGLAIGAIGLALGVTDAANAAVILPYYAVLFVLAIPLVMLPTGAVATVGLLAAVSMPALSFAVRPALPQPRLTNPSIEYLLTDPLGLLAELTLTGYYPALPWVAYLCAGLVVGRLTLTSRHVAVTLATVGVGLAAAATVTSRALLDLGGRAAIEAATAPEVTAAVLEFGAEGNVPTTTWWWLAVDTQHTSTPLDLLHTTGTALAVLGLMLLLATVTHPPRARRVAAAVRGPLAATGAMILTLYVAHVLFLNSPLDVFGPLAGYLVQVGAAVLIAVGWQAAFGRGPLERFVTWLSRSAGRAFTRPAAARRTP
ncbi:MAG: heparan-alpha-glucosaminide N-acetyltransferase domain-containing protein [Pseudonocardia sp.]